MSHFDESLIGNLSNHLAGVRGPDRDHGAVDHVVVAEMQIPTQFFHVLIKAFDGFG